MEPEEKNSISSSFPTLAIETGPSLYSQLIALNVFDHLIDFSEFPMTVANIFHIPVGN
jgi:hypothetical protein